MKMKEMIIKMAITWKMRRRERCTEKNRDKEEEEKE